MAEYFKYSLKTVLSFYIYSLPWGIYGEYMYVYICTYIYVHIYIYVYSMGNILLFAVMFQVLFLSSLD